MPLFGAGWGEMHLEQALGEPFRAERAEPWGACRTGEASALGQPDKALKASSRPEHSTNQTEPASAQIQQSRSTPFSSARGGLVKNPFPTTLATLANRAVPLARRLAQGERGNL